MAVAESPNGKLDKAVDKLLKLVDGDIKVDQESGIKVKADLLRLAIQWEKVKHAIKDQNDDGEFKME